MRNLGVGSWTARRARRTPHRTALIDDDGRWSYAELHERVTKLAHGLRRLGLRRGDRIAYLGPNHHTFLETLFAAGMLGAVFVPLNTRLARPELRHCLADSGSTLLVHDPRLHADADSVRQSIALGQDYLDLLDDSELDGSGGPIDEPVALDDPFVLMYTSGTTGRAKGALLTHGNLTWNAVNVLVDTDLASDDVTLCVAPLFHTAALNMTCLPTLLKGGTVVLLPAFDPELVLASIERHRVTVMFGVPVMFEALACSPSWSTTDLSSLRQLLCGGAPVPLPLIRTYQKRGLVFSQGYGMTETSPGVLFLGSQDSVRKAGTAGVPHFFTDVRVVDDRDRPVGPGEKGEVLVAGPNVMRGYWGRPEETAQVLADGWFRSGDVATVDHEGYVQIVDRVKDVIISGGENVYPAEVELALSAHPDVAECAVIGVPDDKWGEVGKAIVVPTSDEHADEAELLAYLRERLAGYKVPKSVTFTTELPRSATGKVLRKALREEFR